MKTLGTMLLLTAALALTGCGSPTPAATPSATPSTDSVTKLMTARLGCNLGGMPYADLGDNGHTVTLQGQPRNGVGLPLSDLMCVLHGINVPDSVVSQMQGTRALDGTQKADWDTFHASWTYHPDNGLRVIVTEDK